VRYWKEEASNDLLILCSWYKHGDMFTNIIFIKIRL
jgi:hypothetical protein